MTTTRSAVARPSMGTASVVLLAVLAVGLSIAAWRAQAQAPAESAGEQAAVVETVDEGSPARITLTAEAEERLGLQTTAVVGSPSALEIPYSAVVYDNDGAAWTFVEVDERTYQREAVTVVDIVDDRARLSAGPAVGTEVVTVAAAELVGAEAGISGGE